MGGVWVVDIDDGCDLIAVLSLVMINLDVKNLLGTFLPSIFILKQIRIITTITQDFEAVR